MELGGKESLSQVWYEGYNNNNGSDQATWAFLKILSTWALKKFIDLGQ